LEAKNMERFNVVLDVFLSNKKMSFVNQIMKSADLFDNSKILAKFLQFELEIDKEPTELFIKIMKEALEEQNHKIYFMAINSINGSKPKNNFVWFKPNIREIVVDDGKLKCYLFKDILTKKGYNVEISKTLHVVEVYSHFNNN